MDQVERGIDFQGNAYSLFQTAIVLEDQVRERTRNLETGAARAWRDQRAQLSRAKDETETVQTRLLEAIESISEGFMHCDADDRLVLCNRKFLEFWPGIDAVAKAGNAVRDDLPLDRGDRARHRRSIVDPEAWLRRRLRRHRSPGEPIVVHLRTGRWLQIRERMTRDGGIVGIYTDISELKVSRGAPPGTGAGGEVGPAAVDPGQPDAGRLGVRPRPSPGRLERPFIDLLELPDWLVQPGAPLADYLRFRSERGDYGRDGAAAAAVRLETARQRKPLQNDQVLPSGAGAGGSPRSHAGRRLRHHLHRHHRAQGVGRGAAGGQGGPGAPRRRAHRRAHRPQSPSCARRSSSGRRSRRRCGWPRPKPRSPT